VRIIRMLVGVAAAVGVSVSGVAPAGAANSPTFRDCSLVAGVDPDFVQLSGVHVGSAGSLTVPRGQKQVAVVASESSDPGDSEGHVTLTVTLTSKHLATQMVSGAAQGKVSLSVPLPRSRKVGRSYTISWAATFDNGNHKCPSENTPENATPKPFMVTVG
jgi:hypothetical protein